MPPTQTDEGAQAAREIREAHPEVGILLLSQIVEAAHALALFSEHPEGFGYLLKDRVLEIDDFLEAVRRVGRGGTAIDPQVIGQLLGRAREDDPLAELTPREREVLGLMAEGLSNKGICGRLFLSPKTVETHVNSIFLKLRLMPAPDDHRRVLAALAFLKSSSYRLSLAKIAQWRRCSSAAEGGQGVRGPEPRRGQGARGDDAERNSDAPREPERTDRRRLALEALDLHRHRRARRPEPGDLARRRPQVGRGAGRLHRGAGHDCDRRLHRERPGVPYPGALYIEAANANIAAMQQLLNSMPTARPITSRS